jgi:hypothetical protein
MGNLPAREYVDDPRLSSRRPPRHVQVGYEKYFTRLRKFDDRCRSAGAEYLPMEGFDGRRLSKFLGLSARYHEIVLVIAIGKKSSRHVDQPQWRRSLHATVQVL